MLNMIYPRSIFDDPDLAADMVGIPRAVFLERNRQVFERLDSMPWDADLIPVRPHEWLCDDTDCFAAMDGTPYYFDNNHLTVQAARIFAQQVLTLAGEENSP